MGQTAKPCMIIITAKTFGTAIMLQERAQTDAIQGGMEVIAIVKAKPQIATRKAATRTLRSVKIV